MMVGAHPYGKRGNQQKRRNLFNAGRPEVGIATRYDDDGKHSDEIRADGISSKVNPFHFDITFKGRCMHLEAPRRYSLERG